MKTISHWGEPLENHPRSEQSLGSKGLDCSVQNSEATLMEDELIVINALNKHASFSLSEDEGNSAIKAFNRIRARIK